MWAAAAPASPEDGGLCLSMQDEQKGRIRRQGLGFRVIFLCQYFKVRVYFAVFTSCVTVLSFQLVFLYLLLSEFLVASCLILQSFYSPVLFDRPLLMCLFLLYTPSLCSFPSCVAPLTCYLSLLLFKSMSSPLSLAVYHCLCVHCCV